ncbi:MAG TPA: PDZ domain-containing protein, partial [Plantibacter sp.]|uniref:PDZ domain-containing protein n=1 Tax=Plantibacter sp. TaxID=1871045 RepID=UPI002B842FD6|nr:PDZ domain-containing protein [Plantibacter sp.]
ELALGDATLADPILEVFEGRQLPRGISALIGNEFFRGFDVVFDLPGQRLILDRRNPPPRMRNRTHGMVLSFCGEPVVEQVIPGTSADRAGVEVGDRVLATDETCSPADSDDVDAVVQATIQREGEAPREVVLTIEDLAGR